MQVAPTRGLSPETFLSVPFNSIYVTNRVHLSAEDLTHAVQQASVRLAYNSLHLPLPSVSSEIIGALCPASTSTTKELHYWESDGKQNVTGKCHLQVHPRYLH